MPQDGSNNYQYPPGTPGIPDQTIESEAYNTFLDDLVVNDLNIARPVHRGGTGANTADGALTNLSGEKASQVVTNYDAHVWMAGSFKSAAGATNAPNVSSRFAGICYVYDIDNIMLHACDVDTPNLLTIHYIRRKLNGNWGGWQEGFVTAGIVGAIKNDGEWPKLQIERADAHGSAVYIGYLENIGRDSAGNRETYGQIAMGVHDATSGSEDSFYTISTMVNGALSQSLNIGPSGVTHVNDQLLAHKDIVVETSGTPATGAVYLGNTMSRYIQYHNPSDTYYLPGADLNLNGQLVNATLGAKADAATVVLGLASKVTNTGDGMSGPLTISTSTVDPALYLNPQHLSYNGRVCRIITTRGNGTDFYFYTGESGGGADTDFLVRGDGYVASDSGTAMGTPADYADMFEWADLNKSAEDRRGISVVLVGDKVRPATSEDNPDDIIGVVSSNPTVLGRAAWNRWHDKYLLDPYGIAIRDENGQRKLNPTFDPKTTYIPRSDRAEWEPIGLVGILRMRKGCPTGTRWRKMRDIGSEIEEWLIR